MHPALTVGAVHDEPELCVWCYDTPLGAPAGQARLRHGRRNGVVSVDDATTVVWVRGAHRPRVRHLRRESLLGQLVPLLVQSPSGVRSAPDGDFLQSVRAALVPGTSTLVVLAGTSSLDVLRPVVERGVADGGLQLFHAPVGQPGLAAPPSSGSRRPAIAAASWPRDEIPILGKMW